MSIKYKGQTIANVGGGSSGVALEVYSTEETQIGTWIDGKPLYRRVVVGVTPSRDGDKYLFSDVDSLVQVNGHIEMGSSSAKQMGIPWSLSISDQVNACINMANEAIVRIAGSAWRNKPFQLVYEYTKTTDSAVTAATQSVPLMNTTAVSAGGEVM